MKFGNENKLKKKVPSNGDDIMLSKLPKVEIKIGEFTEFLSILISRRLVYIIKQTGHI